MYPIICIAVIFSMTTCFAQSISTTGTPSQEGFAAGTSASIAYTPSTGTPFQIGFDTGVTQTTPATETPFQAGFDTGVTQTTSTTETPSEVGFETTDAQTGSTTAGYNVAISKVLKESDALHVLVANNGTIAAVLTDWKLTLNKGASEYIFPSFTLNPNSMVTVHTHKNANTATDLYGSNFSWNGTRDVELIDQTGKLVSEYELPTL